MYDIYLITNLENGRKYVGCTSKGFERRFKDHCKESQKGSNREICKAIRKHGMSSFEVELIEQHEEKERAFEREKHFIGLLDTFKNGYNQTLGGIGALGHEKSKELRSLISESCKARKAWAGENNPKYNKGHLMRGELHNNYGKPLSEETKKKIGKANKSKMSGLNNHRSVKLTCYAKEMKTGKVYKSNSFYELRLLIESLGVNFNRSMVLEVIRKKRQHHHGFLFYRIDITSEEVINKLEYEYVNNICNSVHIFDHRKGEVHPITKKERSFAVSDSGRVYFSNSWYSLKEKLETETGIKFFKSAMIKVARGEQKKHKGFRFYREDVTQPSIFNDVLKLYEQAE